MNNGSDRKKLNENACKTILHPLPQTSFFHLRKQNKKVGIPPPIFPISPLKFSVLSKAFLKLETNIQEALNLMEETDFENLPPGFKVKEMTIETR